MNKMPNLLRSKAFRSFLYSFIGIFLITFGFMSFVATWHFSENLKNEEIRVTKNKLYTIVEDMETQVDSMRTIAMRIATRNEFSMDYLEKSKYYEIEMLEQLKLFEQPFGIYEKYFIKYSSNDLVYTSEGGTRPFELYCRTEISEDSHEKLSKLFRDLSGKSKVPFTIYKEDGVILWIYPLKNYSTNQNHSEGILCFQITNESLEERIEQLVQMTGKDFILYYEDLSLLGEEKSGIGESIEVNSSKGEFRIIYPLSGLTPFLWKNIFSTKEILILMTVFILLLLSGFVVAYWNYKPMQRIAEKYRTTSEEVVEVEWKSIDNLIASLLSGREKNVEIIQKQYRIIQEQVIGLIVSGKYSEHVKEHAVLLNMKLDAPIYGVITCTFSDVQEIETQRKWIHEAVDDLSDDETILYSSWNSRDELCVLVATDEEYMLNEADELLQSLFETRKLSVRTVITDKSYTLNQIGSIVPKETLEVTDNLELHLLEESSFMKAVDVETETKVKSTTAALAVTYIKENCTKYDLSLDSIAQEFHITPTYLSKIIKQEIGKSYKEFLTELRIDEAKRILRESDTNVTDVCKMTGYTNVSHFIKLFQKNVGVTPAKYREEIIKESALTTLQTRV